MLRALIAAAGVGLVSCSLEPLPVPRADQGAAAGSGGNPAAGSSGASTSTSSSSSSSSGSGGSGGGGPVVLADGQQQPLGIAIDATEVYWTTASTELNRVSKQGGAITVLASTLENPVVHSGWAVAVDDTGVYWTSGSGQRVYRVPAAGGEVTVLLEQMGFPSSIALDASQLYVTTYSDTVLSMPKAGGAVSTLTAEASVFATGIVLGGGWVYWTSGATVLRVPDTGGAVATIVSGASAVAGLTVQGGWLYWSTRVTGSSTGGAIHRADLDGLQETVVAEGLDHPEALAAFGDFVFVLDQGSGELLQVALPTGEITTLAVGTVAPGRIAVDADAVYWTDKGDFGRSNGSVRKAERVR